jgi:hypothetical protein
MCFSATQSYDGLPAGRDGGQSCRGAKLSKTCRFQEDALGAPLLVAQTSAHFAGHLGGRKEDRLACVVNQFCLTINSVRWPRNSLERGKRS